MYSRIPALELMVIVKPPCRIPSEIIRAFPVCLARKYRIVPYGVERGILYCLGEDAPIDGEELSKLEGLCGNKICIESIPARELDKLLKQYYRE